MNLKHITTFLEETAPLSYQESYDNSGLLTGEPEMEIKAALICLDSTEEVVEEAISHGCNLVIAHHPVIFTGLKKLNGKNYVERTIIKAIRNEIAIYAIHTNLDNVRTGVNAKLCEKLGLQDTRILQPREGLLSKLVTFVPLVQASALREALFEAGAGTIGNYDSCSFSSDGHGTFRGNENSKPVVGEKGMVHREAETRIEVIYERRKEQQILEALFSNHPYEEVAYDCYALHNTYPNIGSGMTGILPETMEEKDFLVLVKDSLKTSCIRHTSLRGKPVKKVAVAGGAGSFLLKPAIASGADFFITSDFKYHEFFDAEQRLVIADIGHYESEQFTKELIYGILKRKFPTFALHLSEINTNPVNYF